MAAYGHIYLYMHYFGPQEVHETYSQHTHTQKAVAYYPKLTELRFSATQILCRGL